MSQKLLSKLDCKYGAPIGRPTIRDNPEAKVNLFRVELPQGYDYGGAYWGWGEEPLYAAIGEGFQAFYNAKNRHEAKEKLLKDFPQLKFKKK